MKTRKNILVDIDHVLSNAFWRDQFLGNVSWETYHVWSSNDKPIMDIVTMINALGREEFNIIAVTSRPEKHRRITLDWLLKYNVCVDELLMRPNDDFQKSSELKIMLANNRFPDTKDDIAFLIEDREDVCQVFRKLGITVLQCFARKD